MNEVTQRFSIESYIDKNREKIDESLISLRVMKEVDRFLDYERLTNRDLALKMGYSESYISQLMSGVKNMNVSFINKFEKCFEAKFDFKIYLKKENVFLHKLDGRTQFNIDINLNMFLITEENSILSYTQNSKSMFEVTDIEYYTL
jgi:transcriptional regulator with XRE-family HTH domain